MNTQFTLGRILLLVVVVAVISSVFAQFKWPLALAILSGLNVAAAVYFWMTGRRILQQLALITAALMIATLFLTKWRFSSPEPTIRVAWKPLGAACVAQLLTTILWFLSVPPKTHSRSAEQEDPANNTR